MPKWLLWRVCFSFLHIYSMLSASCNCLGSGTREWILNPRMRHPILHNTRRPFWSMCRMNSVPNMDVCRSIKLKVYRPTNWSPLQRHQDSVNHPPIDVICPIMMKNTWSLTLWLKWHPDSAIVHNTYWSLPGSIWIHHLKRRRTGGKLI